MPDVAFGSEARADPCPECGAALVRKPLAPFAARLWACPGCRPPVRGLELWEPCWRCGRDFEAWRAIVRAEPRWQGVEVETWEVRAEPVAVRCCACGLAGVAGDPAIQCRPIGPSHRWFSGDPAGVLAALRARAWELAKQDACGAEHARALHEAMTGAPPAGDADRPASYRPAHEVADPRWNAVAAGWCRKVWPDWPGGS